MEIVNLGNHPFADTFVPKSKLEGSDMVYPLICDLCENCGQIQARYETDPLLRYSGVDYSYTSSNSSFSKKHWDEFAEEISKDLPIKEDALVVEIGSNDGYLSEQFLKRGARVIGVDPSAYMAELARGRNVETITGLFGEEASRKILEKYGKCDLLIANNVFNHADEPLEFTRNVFNVLKKGGKFVFEQPYWLIGIKAEKFDQIYHEHVSYFTVKSISALLERCGLGIKSVEVVDYHGGSLRVIAQKKEDILSESESALKMIKEEIDFGMFKKETYNKFMQKNFLLRNKFMQKIYKIKEDGGSIVAVGAAAKGNTFLNFYKLDNTLVDFVTDSSPHKKGKYTPATRIPIVGDEIFANYKDKEVYALILSWNISDQLKSKLYEINKNIKFISP